MGAFRFISTDVVRDTRVELYGYLNTPNPTGHHDQAVLLCNPFGQEAVRTNRLYRIIADRLARQGIASLRFDYFGTGDSDGDDDHAPMSVATCIQNIKDADLLLRERAKADQASWFGLRLGALLAAQASTSTPLPPDRLFLWDPIVKGTDWLNSLREDHRKALELMMLTTSTAAIPTDNSKGFESQGYRVTAELAKFMVDFDLSQYQKLNCNRLIVLAASDECVSKLKALDHCPRINSFELTKVAPTHWNSDEAMNTAIVPQDVVSLVTREMTVTNL
jgi:uncharacterized protein